MREPRTVELREPDGGLERATNGGLAFPMDGGLERAADGELAFPADGRLERAADGGVLEGAADGRLPLPRRTWVSRGQRCRSPVNSGLG